MARIPEDQIDRLKQEISLQRLTKGMGVTLKRHGADLIGLCPFHDDHEPSLVISSAKNLWHCLGACQAGGSVIDWLTRAEGVSFRHAVALLQADYAVQGCTSVAGAGSTRASAGASSAGASSTTMCARAPRTSLPARAPQRGVERRSYEQQYHVRDQAIVQAYASGGYSLKAIGDHFGSHYSRISRIVRRTREAKGRTLQLPPA
jgi:hypothetical protein